MAIKKRTPKTEVERAAAIAAFGDGATVQGDAPAEAPAPTRTSTARPAAETSGEVPKTSLVRWSDEDLPRAIQRIAAEEDRSFHKTMLQLLRSGVDNYEFRN